MMKTMKANGAVRTMVAVAIAVGAMTWADNVSAHVDYTFLNSAGGSASLPMKRFGWIDGVITEALGHVSPFRGTVNVDFEGQFNLNAPPVPVLVAGGSVRDGPGQRSRLSSSKTVSAKGKRWNPCVLVYNQIHQA